MLYCNKYRLFYIYLRGVAEMAPTINFFENHIKEIDKLMLRDFQLKGNASIFDFMPINLDNQQRYFYSKLFLLSYFLFKKEAEPKVIGMAAILQYIYLASEIHKYEGKNSEYTVLVGDYLYSKFFQNICKYEMLEFLIPLGKTISVMQLGSIEKIEENRSLNSQIECIVKEKAVLGETSCKIGADMANAPGLAVKCLKQIGFYMGLVFGLLQEKGTSTTNILNYLDEVDEQVKIIQSVSVNKERIVILEQLVNSFKANLVEVSKVG